MQKLIAEEILFQWSHHKISSAKSKVWTTLHVSLIDSESERMKVNAYDRINFEMVGIQ